MTKKILDYGNTYLEMFKRLDDATTVMLGEKKEVFDPHHFYEISTRVLISDCFRENILSQAKSITLPKGAILQFTLSKDGTDSSIQSEVPEGYMFEDASTFCAILAEMIAKQPKGRKGSLCSNNRGNIFFVHGEGGKVFTVSTRWYSAQREWIVSTTKMGEDNIWQAGSRVFFTYGEFGTFVFR